MIDFVLYFGLLSESLLEESKFSMNYYGLMGANFRAVTTRKCGTRIADLLSLLLSTLFLVCHIYYFYLTKSFV